MPKRNSPIQQIKKIVLQYFWVIFKTTCFSVNNRLYLRIGSRNTTDNTRYSKYREKRYFPYPIVVFNLKQPMNNKEIRVNYLHGIDRNDFRDLEIFGFETEIPKEKEQMPIYALGTRPEDYIILFGIYFSLKVTEQLAKG